MDEYQKTENKKEETLVFDSKDVQENKGVAALSYLFILFLVPLLTKRNSKFAQMHAKQGLILCIIEIIASFFYWIPFLGWFLSLVIAVVAIYGIIQALSGKYWPIPLIGTYAEKIKI